MGTDVLGIGRKVKLNNTRYSQWVKGKMREVRKVRTDRWVPSTSMGKRKGYVDFDY